MGLLMKICPLKISDSLKKTEFYFTPKHGSWLNMAEIEFSSLARQCLDRRIASQEILEAEALIWQKNRNLRDVKVNWSFTTEKAYNKLKNRYKENNKITIQNYIDRTLPQSHQCLLSYIFAQLVT